MASEPHHIQKQSIRLDVSSEAVAMALQTQLPDVNRSMLLATVERVLDSYATPDQHIRIPRLSVNLGTIPYGQDFANEVNSRLERELREALDNALRGLASHSPGERISQSADELRLDLLEQYLTSGTLPFWTAAAEFNAEAVVGEAATATPDALVRLLRRHRDDAVVIRRLVGQLGDAGLRRLLELLDPENAGRTTVEVEAVLRARRDDDGRTAPGALAEREPAGDDRRASIWMRVLTDAVQGRGGAGSGGRGFDGPVVRSSGSPVVRQSASPVDREAVDPLVRASGSPVVRQAGSPEGSEAVNPLVRESGSPLVRESARSRVSDAASPEDRASGSPVVRADASPEVPGVEGLDTREGTSPHADEAAGSLVREAGSPVVRQSASPVVRQSGQEDSAAAAKALVREAVDPLVREAASPLVRQSGSPESGESARPQGRGPDAGAHQELALSPYDHAEALEYFLRHGVLPWNAALARGSGRRPLTVDALLEALPDLPLALLRTSFPAAAGERYEAVVRAVKRMPEQVRARLLVALSAEARPGLIAAERAAGDLSDGPAAYARAILRMLDGGIEGRSDTVDSSLAPASVEVPATRWDVHWVKSVLAERARGGERAGPSEPSTARLLVFLIEEHPQDASHFLRVLSSAGISPAALLAEAVSPRLFQGSLMMLPGDLGTVVTLLLQSVRRLPAHEQPGDEDAVVSAATGTVLEHLAVFDRPGSGDQRLRLAVQLLRVLFGPTLAADVVRQLAAEAERLASAGEGSQEDLAALRGAFAARGAVEPTGERATSLAPEQASAVLSPVGPDLASAIPPRIEQPPPAAARRVTQLLRIVSSWPPADRPPVSDETIRASVAQALQQHAGVDPSSAAFMVVALRAILGPDIQASAVRRLLADVESLALRGELTSADVEAVSEAVVLLADVATEDQLRAPDRPAEHAPLQADTPRQVEPAEPPDGRGPLQAEQRLLQAEHIVAELTSRALTRQRARADAPSSSSLLQMLIERSPGGARAFLAKMRDDGISPSLLIDDPAAPRLMESSLDLLRPLDRRLLTLLLRVVSALPPAERPINDEALRSTLARVVLDHAGTASGERLAADVLRALFGPTLPVVVQRRFVAEAERIARSGAFGPEAVIAFLHVIGRPDGTSSEFEGRAEAGADVPAPSRGVTAARDRASVVTTEGRSVTGEDGVARPAASPRPAAPHPDAPAQAQATPRDAPAEEEAAPTRLPERDAAASEAAPPPPRATATHTEAAAALARLRGHDDVEPGAASGGDQFAAPADGADIPPDTRKSAHERPPRLSDDALRHVLLELVDTAPETVGEVVRSGITDPAIRERWVRILSEPELARVTYLLEPAHHRVLISSAELLFTAWSASHSPAPAAAVARAALWSFLLDFLARHAEGQRSVRVLVHGFFAYVGARRIDGAGAPDDSGEVLHRVFDEAVTLASRLGRAHLRAVLAEDRAELLALATAQTSTPGHHDTEHPAPSGRLLTQPTSGDATAPTGPPPSPASLDRAAPLASAPARPSPPKQRMAFGMKDDDAGAGGDPIHLTNAGLVIVGAFLPQLFARLEVLEVAPTGENRVRPDAVSRVVHLLQYLADGRTDAPEPLLCLNKVLCGVPLVTPIDREIELTVSERELCDSLLAAMIDNWPMMKSSSVGALRETFLQREGRLDHPPGGWRLHVQRKTLDILLDHIPWPISTIANSWMPEPLFVTW